VPVDHNHPGADQEAASHQLHTGKSLAILGGRPLLPNSGIPLDLNWVQEVRVNSSAVERRTQTQVARRTVKKDWQAAWLLRAITCMDLTTLSGDDTEERVRRLCAKARQPLQQDLGFRPQGMEPRFFGPTLVSCRQRLPVATQFSENLVTENQELSVLPISLRVIHRGRHKIFFFSQVESAQRQEVGHQGCA